MRHSLHLLCPPSRKTLLKDVKVTFVVKGMLGGKVGSAFA
jgi:hypothetical protein